TQLDRLTQPPEVPRRARAAADVPRQQTLARRRLEAADVRRNVDVAGGLQGAEVVELVSRRLEVDARVPLPRPRSLAAARPGVPADQPPCGGVEVEVARVGALEVMRRAGFDERDSVGRSDYRRPA